MSEMIQKKPDNTRELIAAERQTLGVELIGTLATIDALVILCEQKLALLQESAITDPEVALVTADIDSYRSAREEVLKAITIFEASAIEPTRR